MTIEDVIRNGYSGKRCLVLGGAGMLGSYLCEELIRSGAGVVVIDGNTSLCDYIPNKVEHLRGDIDEGVDLNEFGSDYVFNLAAQVAGITWNERNHFRMMLANSSLAYLPVSFLREGSNARYVYISSACVYPHDAPVPTPEEWGHRGDPEPANLGYGLAKRFGERLALLAGEETALSPLVLRPSNLYSERDKFLSPHAHVIPRIMRRVLGGEDPLVVRGTGSAQRSFLHARDAAQSILLAALTDETGPFNLAASEELTIRNLVHKIVHACMMSPAWKIAIGEWKHSTTVEWDPGQSDGYDRRLSDPRLLLAALERAGLPAWKPMTTLDDALPRIAEACRKAMARDEQ